MSSRGILSTTLVSRKLIPVFKTKDITKKNIPKNLFLFPEIENIAELTRANDYKMSAFRWTLGQILGNSDLKYDASLDAIKLRGSNKFIDGKPVQNYWDEATTEIAVMEKQAPEVYKLYLAQYKDYKSEKAPSQRQFKFY